jgi:hypothetical protein
MVLADQPMIPLPRAAAVVKAFDPKVSVAVVEIGAFHCVAAIIRISPEPLMTGLVGS